MLWCDTDKWAVQIYTPSVPIYYVCMFLWVYKYDVWL